MKTIIANLKLYMNLNSWFFAMMLIILIFFNIQVVSDQKANEQVIVGSFMTLPFILGFIASIVLIDVMNKPFSFCLPGHRQNVKKILMIMGILVSFFFTFLMYFFILNRLQFNCFISIFFATFVSFFLGAELYMFARNICALLFMMSFFLFTYHLPLIILGRFILQHPLIMLCIGLGSSITSWQLLNSPGLARRFCAIPLLIGPFDFYNRDKITKYAQYKEASRKGKRQKEIKPSVEKFFLNKMKNHEYLSKGRYIWGGLFSAFALSISTYPLVNLLITFISFSLLCYFKSVILFFIMPFVVSLVMPLPVYSNMLISDGRKERFYGALVISIAITGYVIVPLTIITIISQLAEPFMPDLAFPKITFVFHAASFKFFLIPLIIVPIVLTFKLVFHKRFTWMVLSIIVLYACSSTFLISVGLIGGTRPSEVLSTIINPISMVIFIVSVWTIFVAALRHVCSKWSLI